MSDNSRPIKGVTFNKFAAMGVVVGDPTFAQDRDKKYAFLQLKTGVSEMAANGQWVTTYIDVPLIVSNPSTVTTVEKYVKDGRELYIEAYFKSWVDGTGNQQIGFIVTTLKLGNSPYKPKE